MLLQGWFGIYLGLVLGLLEVDLGLVRWSMIVGLVTI